MCIITILDYIGVIYDYEIRYLINIPGLCYLLALAPLITLVGPVLQCIFENERKVYTYIIIGGIMVSSFITSLTTIHKRVHLRDLDQRQQEFDQRQHRQDLRQQELDYRQQELERKLKEFKHTQQEFNERQQEFNNHVSIAIHDDATELHHEITVMFDKECKFERK